MDSLAWRGPRRRKSFRTSLGFAWAGLRYGVQTQPHLRFHLATAAVVLAAGTFLGVSPLELALLLGTITLVIVTELLNTAVEAIVDLVTTEYHPLAKVAKDIAAGVVLAAAGGAVLVGLVIFLPYLIAILG